MAVKDPCLTAVSSESSARPRGVGREDGVSRSGHGGRRRTDNVAMTSAATTVFARWHGRTIKRRATVHLTQVTEPGYDRPPVSTEKDMASTEISIRTRCCSPFAPGTDGPRRLDHGTGRYYRGTRA